MRNLSYEHEFSLLTIKTHFHITGFALDLALKQRQNATQKWPLHLLMANMGNLKGLRSMFV